MRTKFIILRCLFLFLIIFTYIYSLKIHSLHEQTYSVKNKFYWFNSSPDGIKREILGSNGDFAKNIRVERGANIQMTIENLIPNSLTNIHFHGILQKGSLTSDGVGGTTQCDPEYKQKYDYNFNTAGQSGTYFYHSNTRGQSLDGLKGALIIENPDDPYLRPFNYFVSSQYLNTHGIKDKKAIVSSNLHYADHSIIDGEPDSVIILSEWYHIKSEDLLKNYMSTECNRNLLIPDSALINNIGNFKCKNPPNCESMYHTNIVAGKAKRFRIINSSNQAVFHFTIQDHKMHLIECDGVLLDGNTSVRVLRINAGQRYSIIIQANEEPKNYWIRAVMDETIYPEGSINHTWQPEVFGELRYVNSNGERLNYYRPSNQGYDKLDKLIMKSVYYASKNIDMENLVPLKRFTPPPPENPNKKIVLDIKHMLSTDGKYFLGFNKVVYGRNIEKTVLGEILNYRSVEKIVEKNGLTYGYNPKFLKHGDVIDLIVNNYYDLEISLHLHGYNFYVMYQGHRNSKEYITDPKQKYKFKYNYNATKRDTVTVNANSSLVLRFIADNPGVWVFRTNNVFLLESGLMATFIEDEYKIRKLYWKNKHEVSYCKYCDISQYEYNPLYVKKDNLFYIFDGHRSDNTFDTNDKLVTIRNAEKSKIASDEKNRENQDIFKSLDDMPEIKEIMNTVESMQTSEEQVQNPTNVSSIPNIKEKLQTAEPEKSKDSNNIPESTKDENKSDKKLEEPDKKTEPQNPNSKEPDSTSKSLPEEAVQKDDQAKEEAKKEIIRSILGSLTGQSTSLPNNLVENTEKDKEPLQNIAIKENIKESVLREEDRS